MKLTLKILAFFFLAFNAFAQTTPEAAVPGALQNHPLARAAAFDVQSKKHKEKTALNIPNPEINAESPTGEFYAIGVSQSFEFPTVYTRQKKVAKAETALAQASQRMSENDLCYTVRSLYLEAQVAVYQATQWGKRDSLYEAIATAAGRQFAAGEIDFLQKTMAENEAGKVRQELLAAEQTAAVLYQQLAALTGLVDLGLLLPLSPDTLGLVAMPGLAGNPSVAYEQQAAQVTAQQISLAKSRALPNFSLGYMNQGERSTPLDYRFRASVGVPLWLGQYRAATSAATAESQAAVARAEAQTQAVLLESQRAYAEAAAALAQVRYHHREALPRSRALIAAATRLREAGQLDYVSYLRMLDEAFAIQREYAEQVNALNAARLRMRYLAGTW